jgi:ribulose-phosphate 3-epimerase
MRITPSVLNADLSRLSDEIARIPSADGVHLDVMDDHFVPNMTFGLPVVTAVRAATTLPLDIHLMIEDPDRWAPGYTEAGAEIVTFHIEAASAPIRLIREIHRLGGKAGVALNPATPANTIAALVDEIDLVLVMSVEPGFGGQSFLPVVLPKVAEIRHLITASGRDILLQMDGGVSDQTIARCVEAGADTFVAGSAVFRADDPDVAVTQLRDLAKAAASQNPPDYDGAGFR